MAAKPLAFIAFKIAPKEVKIAKLQLEKIFKTKEGLNRVVKNVFYHSSLTAVEFINLKPIISNSEKYISLNNPEIFQNQINSDRPLIALSAHTSNWELLAAYCVNQGIPLIAIGKQMRSKLAHQILSGLREKHGVKTAWRGDVSGTKELLKELRNGAALGCLIDQDIKLNGEISNFFGYKCKTSTALIELGLKTNANFVSAFIFRTDSEQYKIYLNEISSKDCREILNQYHQHLEDLIQKYPTQWVWYHKRWRSQSKDKTFSSGEYFNFLENLK